MAHDKTATSHGQEGLREERVQPSAPAKKPYVKPVLRRLGSVRELTQTNPSNGK